MRIKFGRLEIDFDKECEAKPETFHERFRRESREFHDDMDDFMNRFR